MPGIVRDGVAYPSVTEVLRDVGLGWPLDLPSNAYAMALGRYAHEAIALTLNGQAEGFTFHADLAPALTAFRAFRDAVSLVPRAVETEVLSTEWRLVGHPDFVGYINGRSDLAIIDWKYTNALDVSTVRLQVAGYRWLWNLSRPDFPVRATYAVQLRKDGSYNLVDVTDDAAINTVKAAVLVWQARKEMGRLNGRVA